MSEVLGYVRDLSPLQVGLLLTPFGMLAGSFCNVILHRVPRRRSVVWPGSHCPACGRGLRAWELVPILSFLWLKGRCRSCSVPIGTRYLVVEAGGGVVALLLGLTGGMQAGVLGLVGGVILAWMSALLLRRHRQPAESGAALIEVILAVGLLGAVLIPMLDLGGLIRGGTPFQRQMAVSLAASKMEELANDAWLLNPWPSSGSFEGLDVGMYLFDLEWSTSPYTPSVDDFPSENAKLRKAVVTVTCQNCTRPMPPVKVVAILAKR